MINLKDKIAAAIAAAMEIEKNSLLDHDWADSFTFYENDIKKGIKEYFEDRDLSDDMIAAAFEWLWQNQDQSLKYTAAGFPYVSSNEFALASIGEIEIPVEFLDVRITPIRVPVINRWTDLYVNESADLAYINCGYDFIAVDFDSIPWDEIEVTISLGSSEVIDLEVPILAIWEIGQGGDNTATVEKWIDSVSFYDIDQDQLSRILSEFGAWDDDELSDYSENEKRALWIACHDEIERIFDNA